MGFCAAGENFLGQNGLNKWDFAPQAKNFWAKMGLKNGLFRIFRQKSTFLKGFSAKMGFFAEKNGLKKWAFCAAGRNFLGKMGLINGLLRRRRKIFGPKWAY